jgi:hypothetical protein
MNTVQCIIILIINELSLWHFFGLQFYRKETIYDESEFYTVYISWGYFN